MRQKPLIPTKNHDISGKLRATDHSQTEHGHSATGRNVMDTWDQWEDLNQNSTKQLSLKYRNECTYKVTATASWKCWAKDLSRGAVLNTELLHLHRLLQELHLPYQLYQQPSWISHSLNGWKNNLVTTVITNILYLLLLLFPTCKLCIA